MGNGGRSAVVLLGGVERTLRVGDQTETGRVAFLGLDVEITSAPVPASAQRMAVHYTATPRAVRVSGVHSGGEIQQAKFLVLRLS